MTGKKNKWTSRERIAVNMANKENERCIGVFSTRQERWSRTSPMCHHLMNQLYQIPPDNQVYNADNGSWLGRINEVLWSIHTTPVWKWNQDSLRLCLERLTFMQWVLGVSCILLSDNAGISQTAALLELFLLSLELDKTIPVSKGSAVGRGRYSTLWQSGFGFPYIYLSKALLFHDSWYNLNVWAIHEVNTTAWGLRNRP